MPTRKSQIDQFAEMVHPRDGHPKIFAMIHAYLDESGIHDGARICVIAGYFGGRGQWKKLEDEWRKVLQAYHVPLAEFHAKDLLRENGGGFFFRWPERASLARSLASVISEHHKIHPVSAGVIIEDFNGFNEDQRRVFTGATLKGGKLITTGAPSRPYFMPFIHCMRKIACYASVGGRAHFFFGIDTQFYAHATELFENIKNNPYPIESNCRDRLGDPSFPLAKETPELQAADFLAYLNYRHMTERAKDGKWGEIQPDSLLHACMFNARSVDDFQYFDKRSMEAVLEDSYRISGKWDDPPPRAIVMA